MRRFRTLFLLITLVGSLLGPLGASSQAQLANSHGWRVDALVTGETAGGDPAITPNNRVSSDNGYRGVFDDVAIFAVIDCQTSNSDTETVVANLESGHNVHFTSDDDVTDGFGEILPTDTNRRFTSAGSDFGAREIRSDGQQGDAQVDVRIVDGRYHRLFGLVQVDLTLDIRVMRLPDETLQCETRTERYVPFRILLELFPNEDLDPLGGFNLVGVGSRHNPGDRNIIRDICGMVGHQNVPPDNRVCGPTQPPT